MLIILFLFALFAVGFPIGFSLGIVAAGSMVMDGLPLAMAIQKMLSGVDSIPVTAILMFTLAGALMMHGGISTRLIAFADVLVGHLPSGMAMVSILGCMFFAALTGSAIAATAAIGGIMIPIMTGKGYDKEFSAPLLSTAGSIGPIIPPSIPLLLFGVIANCSVAKLFMGGIIPGIFMGISLMVVSYILGKKRNYIGRDKRASLGEVGKAGVAAVWALLTPIIILGGIMSGYFTATESAAVAVAYSIFVGMCVYRELTWKALFESMYDSAKTTGMVLLVVGFASLFTWVVTIHELPQQLTESIETVIETRTGFLLLINLILLIAGTFIDTTSAVVIFTPLFTPLAVHYGVDLIHFGVVMAVNLTIGMCTPPLGVCLFVSSGIAKIPLEKMFRDLVPLLAALLAVLAIVTFVPETVLWVAHNLVK